MVQQQRPRTPGQRPPPDKEDQDVAHDEQNSKTDAAQELQTGDGGGGGGQPGALPGTGDNADLGAFEARIVSVCDPVSFMTDASYNASFDDGASPFEEDAFFELAQAECDALVAELATTDGGGPLADFLVSWRDLYADLQGTADMGSADLSDSQIREARAQAIQQTLGVAEGMLQAVPEASISTAGRARIEQAMAETDLFLEAWSDLSATSDLTNASPTLWGSYLQTIQRQRSILEEYDKLDERGGEARHHKRVKGANGYYANDAETAEQFASEEGGWMALALKSYGLKADTMAAYEVQIAEVTQRILAGEFTTDEEAIDAMKAYVGGGQTGSYYAEQLEEIAKAGFETYLSKHHQELGREGLSLAEDQYQGANDQVDKAGEQVDDATGYAKSREDNYSLSTSYDDVAYSEGGDDAWAEGFYETYDVLSADHQKRWSNEDEVYVDPETGLTTTIPVATKSEYFDGIKYQQYGEIISFSAGMGEANRHSWARDQFSDQEWAIRSVDQEGADKALQRGLLEMEEARTFLGEAKAMLEQGDAALAESEHNAKLATYHLGNARMMVLAIDLEAHPEMATSVALMNKELDQVERDLKQQAQDRERLGEYRSSVDDAIDRMADKTEGYDPEKMEVPKPAATIDGKALEQERYDSMKLTVSFPLGLPILQGFGWIEGESAQSSDMDGGNLWSKAKIEIGGGVKADLWLAEIAIKAAGFFEAEVRGDHEFDEVLEKGTAELLRWAYAWWYESKSVRADVLAALDQASDDVDVVMEQARAAATSGQDALDEFASERAVDSLSSARERLGMSLAMAVVTSDAEGDLLSLADEAIHWVGLTERLQGLEGVDPDEAPGVIDGIAAWSEDDRKTGRAEADRDLKDIDPGTNDPDVKFKAGVSLTASATFGTSSASLGAEAQATMTITDGSEDSYDTSTHASLGFKLSGEVKGAGKVEVGATAKSEGEYSVQGKVEIPIFEAPGDGSEIVSLLRKQALDIASDEAFGIEHVGESMLDMLTDMEFSDYLALMDGGSAMTASFGVELTFVEGEIYQPLSFKGGKVTFGIEQSQKLGADFGSAEVELEHKSGYKVTAEF